MKIDAPFAYGFRDQEGPTRWAWGEEKQSPCAQLRLDFRDFHHPHPRRPSSLWEDFPSAGQWALENYAEGSVATPHLPALPLGEGIDQPSEKEWRSFCAQIEIELGAGHLLKAVPARSRSFRLSAEVRARLQAELLPRLLGGPSHGGFRFFLKHQEQCFFGATPEMLFRRRGEKLLVPAIAGTRFLPRPELEEEISRELLANAKERGEHQIVVDGIRKHLHDLGMESSAPTEPRILRLRHLLHLYTPIEARGSASSAELLSLHPTAAVGGAPQAAAQSFLREVEPWDRGLFASPLLFCTPEEEICLVGIRSALLTETHLHFFAGAGYVPGSNPEAEWRETGKKMDSLQLLLEEERV